MDLLLVMWMSLSIMFMIFFGIKPVQAINKNMYELNHSQGSIFGKSTVKLK